MEKDIQKAKETNALVLAFLGDAVYNLKIKAWLVKTQTEKAGMLNRFSTKFIRASAQAQVFDVVKSEFDEDEQNVASRAKNIHTTNVPKNSNLEEYKKATSLEAVVGFLFLCGKNDKIDKIIERAKENL